MNTMGHHVWKIIRSKSVFTRVTDGQRLTYYTIYMVTVLSIIVTIAVCIHFLVEEGQEGYGNYMVGWPTLAAFYIPVAGLLTVNVYFYWTSQRTMSKQLMYNRSMQHFQVK